MRLSRATITRAGEELGDMTRKSFEEQNACVSDGIYAVRFAGDDIYLKESKTMLVTNTRHERASSEVEFRIESYLYGHITTTRRV